MRSAAAGWLSGLWRRRKPSRPGQRSHSRCGGHPAEKNNEMRMNSHKKNRRYRFYVSPRNPILPSCCSLCAYLFVLKSGILTIKRAVLPTALTMPFRKGWRQTKRKIEGGGREVGVILAVSFLFILPARLPVNVNVLLSHACTVRTTVQSRGKSVSNETPLISKAMFLPFLKHNPGI